MKKQQTCLVTGGAGFIGSHLADQLVERGYRTIVVDNLSAGHLKNVNPQAVFHKLDIRSSALAKVFRREKPEAVFHYAAKISVPESTRNPGETEEVNVGGLLNVLELCRKFKTRKFIFASTAGVYGEADSLPLKESVALVPLSPYAISKASGEYYTSFFSHAWELETVILRLANVFGPRQRFEGEGGVIAVFSHAMLKRKTPVIYGTGKQTRDFIFVKDVVRANLLALGKGRQGIANISTGKEVSVLKLYETLQSLTDFARLPRYAPARPGDLERNSMSNARAKKLFYWSPRYSFREGLEETVAWYRTHL